jgi:hypothetical protein
MYSAVFLGWPTTSIRPSRWTSTPTWSIEVASTTSKGESVRYAVLLAGACVRDALASARGGVVVRVELQAEAVECRPISAEAMREVSSSTLRRPKEVPVGVGKPESLRGTVDAALRRRRPCSGPCLPVRGWR